MVGFLGPTEIVLIALAVGIFFFGKNKVLDWAKTFGEVKKEMKEAQEIVKY